MGRIRPFRSRFGAAPALLALLALALPGCDSSTSPVAPSDTILTLSANPPSVGLQGSSTLTVTALHSRGGPAREGTEVTFSTNLGRVEPATGRTDRNGNVRATFFADGRSGSAQVRAVSGTVSAQVSINVQPARPTASFSFQANELTVIFTDGSSGNPTRWDWDFGDGGSSRQENPVHTYAQAGTYTVSLTVTNAEGSDTASQFVTVQ